MSKICIVLATYNGAKYLPAMLDSLVAQSRPVDVMIVVDDGSNDNSCEVLEQYGGRLPLQIFRSEKNQGHQAAFSRALTIAQQQLTGDDMIALADQDDVWLPQKLEMLANALDETVDGQKLDLVFGDAQVVNGEGELIADSWRKLSSIPEHLSLRALCTGFSNVTGCLSMFRASLLDVVLPIPQDVYVHDQWITLCASSRNGYRAISEPVLQYRIHGDNAIGLGDKCTWSAKHQMNLNWARMLLKTQVFLNFSEADKEFVVDYVKYMESRLNKSLIPGFLPWVFANADSLYPHIHAFSGKLPRILYGMVGVPFAKRFLGKK